MTSRLPRLGAALVLAATALLVTSCASAAPEPEPTGTVASTPTPTAPAPEATETEAPVAEDLTCDNMILASTIADFTAAGWSSQAEPFYIGALELPGGLLCKWADLEGPAGDHLNMYGWAPISTETAEELQATLVGEGWIREDAPQGVYITENPDTAMSVDDQGYGWTYLFSESDVKFSNTKQGILLVDWPKG
ncbi:hypothetical protein GCM10009775_03940 [Microbacterium aoyamense]|uniref:Lipoprotein n=1 Tax=Microbacterium aoyamense TaxID=344166 RepID=A0ABP5ANI4_9MICO|nr:hypothetical protein [Microbacterium aoyamense]